MGKMYKSIEQRQNEASEVEQGMGDARETTYIIEPVREFSGMEIRQIRRDAGMTQAVFAYYMGVSKKTVEAWEGGRTHPTGPVFRLLNILKKQNEESCKYVIDRRIEDKHDDKAISDNEKVSNYMDSEAVINKLKEICRSFEDILGLVILFGSYSRKEENENSDIDLYIEPKDRSMTTLNFGRNKRYKEFKYALYEGFPNEFDLLAYGGKRDLAAIRKAPIWRQIERDGVIIYDQGAEK